MQANSEHSSLVSPLSSKNGRSVDNNNKAKLAAAVDKVAQGLTVYAESMHQLSMDQQRTQQEQEIFELELKIAHPDAEKWAVPI
mmetsp:Transcript_32412/g.34895  ORF Transcript_32412/g.34895 Transcript_32412/m.34895 type:complete len:84 (-) Transcript_32412:120-371(-)